jgi:hypothetical protein
MRTVLRLLLAALVGIAVYLGMMWLLNDPNFLRYSVPQNWFRP